MSAAPAAHPVAIVGAGWGGLAAAVELVARGHAVHLLEAAPAPGGRARGLTLGGLPLDNGQHLLLGAYRETLRLMRRVGADPGRLLARRRLALTLEGPGERFALRLPPGPAPAALVAALATARGIPARDRWRALARAPRLRRAPARETSAAAWLDACGQPPSLRRALWDPLCLAALNAPAGRASASVFARVLAEAFGGRGASDLLLPRTDLGGLFPRPAVAWLRAHGAAISFGARVRALTPVPGGWRLDTGDGPVHARHAVLATDAAAAAALLPDEPECRPAAERLRRLGAAPITTIYLRYDERVALPAPMLGRLDAPGQWLFDRRLTGQPGVVAVVISGDGPHMGRDRDALAAEAAAQLARAHPDWPRPEPLGVVRERRATFDCRAGSDALRGDVAGPLPGLWLAGDHVATGLPATLEGAVRAGTRCARAVDAMLETET